MSTVADLNAVTPCIRLLTPADAAAYAAHMARHAAENGQENSTESSTDRQGHFMPYPRGTPYDAARCQTRAEARWARPLGAPGADGPWARTFGAVLPGTAADDLRIVGHVDLDSHGLPSAAHRVQLSMGLEAPWRGRGLGDALLAAALEWAAALPAQAHTADTRLAGCTVVELGVFAHNARARKLYARHGFVEMGTTPAAFIVDGVVIDDVRMRAVLPAVKACLSSARSVGPRTPGSPCAG